MGGHAPPPDLPKSLDAKAQFFLAKNYFHPLIQEKEEFRKKSGMEEFNAMQKIYLAVVIPVQFPLPLPFSRKKKKTKKEIKETA